jgi:hypothetical protein
LEPLVGTYVAKEGPTLVVDLPEGHLRGALGGRKFLLVATAPTRFRPQGLPPGYAVVFEKGDKGAATAATLIEPGSPELRLIRQP